MEKIKIILLLTIFPLIVFSQENTIQGTITNIIGEPIPGVTILLEGTQTGSSSDFDGNYTINTQNKTEGVLVFSYVGFTTVKISFVKDSKTINTVLEESTEELDEIVITALGIKRDKKSLSYSTQSVDSEDMKEARSTNFLNALAGKASGVQVRREVPL